MKKLPVSDEKIKEIAREYGTPFHLYDEKAIRKNAPTAAASVPAVCLLR